jgi:hypothetical protein
MPCLAQQDKYIVAKGDLQIRDLLDDLDGACGTLAFAGSANKAFFNFCWL